MHTLNGVVRGIGARRPVIQRETISIIITNIMFCILSTRQTKQHFPRSGEPAKTKHTHILLRSDPEQEGGCGNSRTEIKELQLRQQKHVSYLTVRLVPGAQKTTLKKTRKIDVVNVLGQGLTCQEKWGHLSGRRMKRPKEMIQDRGQEMRRGEGEGD